MTHVHVLYAWDEFTRKATCQVFSSREDAEREKERYLEGHSFRVADIYTRRIR